MECHSAYTFLRISVRFYVHWVSSSGSVYGEANTIGYMTDMGERPCLPSDDAQMPSINTYIPLANAIDFLIISLSIAKLLIKNKPQNKNQEKIYLLRLNDILNVVRALVLIARSGYHRCVFCGTLIGCDVRSCYHHSFH